MYRWATGADASVMAALFAANRRDSLTERQRDEQGFVQGGFDAATLRAMAAAGSLLVADDDGQVAVSSPSPAPTNCPRRRHRSSACSRRRTRRAGRAGR
ncbi:hypothetical protein [Streptomyces sp. NPDC059262]|uniref:hypothetical protein n=1 Tax=Streptomyces sp. NPDC059262 TaxID=3346797 RepID=UPI0036B622BE